MIRYEDVVAQTRLNVIEKLSTELQKEAAVPWFPDPVELARMKKQAELIAIECEALLEDRE